MDRLSRRVHLLNQVNRDEDLFFMEVYKFYDRKRKANVVQYFISAKGRKDSTHKAMWMYQNNMEEYNECRFEADKMFNAMLAMVVRWNRRWQESKRRIACRALTMTA